MTSRRRVPAAVVSGGALATLVVLLAQGIPDGNWKKILTIGAPTIGAIATLLFRWITDAWILPVSHRIKLKGQVKVYNEALADAKAALESAQCDPGSSRKLITGLRGRYESLLLEGVEGVMKRIKEDC